MNKLEKIFFCGIGGIGVSALARLLYAQGKKISGSDLLETQITKDLEAEGLKIFIGQKRQNLPADTELLIYSVAVPETSPERQTAHKLNIPQLPYPKALAEFSCDYKAVGVAGTNGKTTTTAMIGWILEQAGFDPTVIVGSKVLAWNSNARLGRGEYLVLEADEYRRAFLYYNLDIAVITNIAADHLDYFQDLADVQSAFAEFAGKIKTGGALVYNGQDQNSAKLAKLFSGRKIEFQASSYKLRVPGQFNQENAAAAATVCLTLGVSEEMIRNALSSFTGTWRRFEHVGDFGKTKIYSDYAHHPDGIEVTLRMLEETFPATKILVVFQPHQHNRTKKLFTDFVNAFCQSRQIDFMLSEIFEVAGREENADQDVSSKDLVREIAKCGKKVEYAKDLPECGAKVREIAKNYDLIVFMGAGNIYEIADKLTGRTVW